MFELVVTLEFRYSEFSIVGQVQPNLTQFANTKSLAKEFSKILIFEYFGYMKIGFDVFFDADSESPRMT